MVSPSSEKALPLADPLDNKDDRETKYCNAMTVQMNFSIRFSPFFLFLPEFFPDLGNSIIRF